ncbi:MAG: hypothetical protein N3F10_04710 [Candidatus Bathyarchaeota archaeon]|nr:hypothetical protein [Candidatus Bathyarchaeota archaeon]MCX8177583.1 hypothetical protein [Candidatus Bathyarchaeota archaeon]MDW8194291.1 hypothetical protein [Nitrososphaerota archaeon]
MTPKNDLIRFIEGQVRVEREIVDSLNEALKDMENQPVKGVLQGISLDSLKHAEMYSSALMLLTTTQKALTQEQLDRQKSLVKKHMRIESELIERISAELEHVENEKVKLLLTAILEDEKRHHRLLKEILEILVQGETITDDDWWEILWKNVPFHGSPGG